MPKRVYLLPAAILLVCLGLLALLLSMSGTVMVTDPDGNHGRLVIPSAGIATSLTSLHQACTCCELGLWNGGRVVSDLDLTAVSTGDWAHIRHGDLAFPLECAEVLPCLRLGGILLTRRGLLRPEGDVLIWSRGRVWRFVRP